MHAIITTELNNKATTHTSRTAVAKQVDLLVTLSGHGYVDVSQPRAPHLNMLSQVLQSVNNSTNTRAYTSGRAREGRCS